MAPRRESRVKYLRQPSGLLSARGEIRRIYFDISRSLEALDVVSHELSEFSERAAAAILLADLECLEEECETYLVVDCSELAHVFESLDARSQTVLEEVHEFLQRAEADRQTRPARPRVSGHSGHRHPRI